MLFLDEFPEFPRDVLENCSASRWRMGSLSIARSAMTLRFPSSFMLVAAMNPCKCGFLRRYHSASVAGTPGQIQHYLGKISGPPARPHRYPRRNSIGPLQGTARQYQCRIVEGDPRPRGTGAHRPARPRLLQTPACRSAISAESAPSTMPASAPSKWPSAAWDSPPAPTTGMLKVARTVADLDHSPNVTAKHLAKAVQYRSLDRNYWT